MKWWFLIAFICFVSNGYAQRRCQVTNSAKFKNQEKIFKPENLKPNLNTRETIFLPLVIHVVYNDEKSNISDAQIHSQIDALNQDFAGERIFFHQVPHLFRQHIGIPNIQFCLVAKDPLGSPTNGITRTKTPIPNPGIATAQEQRYVIHYDEFGGKSGWDPSRYINIWIGEMGGLFGRATLPKAANHPEEDGIVIDPNYFGTILGVEPPYDLGRTLVHEMGHYLGLLHLWGNQENDCGEDDLVMDTPLQSHAYTGCPLFPQQSCESADMFMNFMDLTTDRCYAFFTKGQVSAMHQTITWLRNSLIDQTPNCIQPNAKPSFDRLKVYYQAISNRLVAFFEPASYWDECKISIFNLTGQRIYSSDHLQNTFTFTLDQNLPTGIYFILIENEGNYFTKKLFIN